MCSNGDTFFNEIRFYYHALVKIALIFPKFKNNKSETFLSNIEVNFRDQLNEVRKKNQCHMELDNN